MPLTSQPIPSTDLTKRTANKPCIVGLNLLEIAYGLGATQLVANTTGTLAAGDSSAAGFERKDLTLRFSHKLWKSNAAGTAWYIVIDQGPTTEWVDTLVIENHNFDTKDIKVEADDTTPSGDPWGTTVFSFTQSGSALIFKLHASTMYKARYWRIKVSGTSFTPQASQIWLGKAVQFLHKSNRPYQPIAVGSAEATVKTTRGGHRYAYSSGPMLEERTQTWQIAGVYKRTGATTDPELLLSAIVDLWTSSRGLKGGIAPFWYCENPTADPTNAKLVYPVEPRLQLVEVGPLETLFTLATRQQGTA